MPEQATSGAQTELKRAYLHVSFGQFDEGIAACERAAELAPEHHLPPALKGSFELAAGRMRQALSTLREATRRHKEHALPWIYFAEACFLGGRHRQGWRALSTAETLAEEDDHRRLLEQLRETWESIEPEEVPPPLEVETPEP